MLKHLQTTVEDLPSHQPLLVLLEVTVVTLLLPGLGLYQQPRDPFFLQASFPWLVLAPLVLGLRYGFAQGLSSAAALGVLMFAALRSDRLGVSTYPATLALGLLLIGMLAGEFCDMWHRRLHRLSELNYYQHLSMSKFSRSYHLLSQSHERLEARVLANPRSLRETITYLRERAVTVQPDSGDRSELYHLMMEVLSSFGQLQVAALYCVDDHDILVPQVVAKLGNPKAVSISDPMLVEALQTKQITCIGPEESPQPEVDGSEPMNLSKTLLAVIPLVDVHGRLWGVVTVQTMPYEALSREHLSLLAVIAGHMGDMLALVAGGGMYQFHTCLLRCHHDARMHRLKATLLAVVLDPTRSPATLLNDLLEQNRSLDQPWLTRNQQGHPVLLLVLPLTDAEGARSFVQRLEVWHQEHHGRSLGAAGVRIHFQELDGVGAANAKLQALRLSCDAHGS